MDPTEEMDLDSLMELLDDNETFEENTSINSIATNNPENNRLSTFIKQDGSESKEWKNKFDHDFLSPKIKNLEEKKKLDNSSITEKVSVVHTGESDPEDENEYLTETGKTIKKEIERNSNLISSKPVKPRPSTWKSKSENPSSSSNNAAVDNSFKDSYSGIRIINPLVSFSTLQQRMEGRRMIKMSFIQNFIKKGDIEGDWVTIGVVIQKIPPKKSANGKMYSIWKMSDLHDVEKPVSVFLFKTAYNDLWKTDVGTVIGILNPSIMSNRDKVGELSLAVDQPGKCMIMGRSKDLGFCKSKRKDGMPCNVPVNIIQCEYCIFHIRKEYKKFSGKRSELQSAYSGREPNLKNKVLKGQNVFYGGQSFVALGKKPSKQIKTKDKLTLSNLGLKRKAEALESEEKERAVKKLGDIYGPEILKVAEKNSEFINNKLTMPTVGSRNLLHHLMQDKSKQGGEAIKVISPKDQLKLFESRKNLISNKQNDSLTLKNLMPQLGRGLKPGQEVSLDFVSPKCNNTQDYAKLKAIKLIKEKGPLKGKDPNSVKVSEDSVDKVKVVLDRCLEDKKDILNENAEKKLVVTSKLGTLDMNSERVKEILQRKSSHAYEIEMAEMEKEAAYFNALEKKEKMEEKMASTTEIVCDVVSCKKSEVPVDYSDQEVNPELIEVTSVMDVCKFSRCGHKIKPPKKTGLIEIDSLL
ncbi:protein MCM10 homolog [Trichonephila inaurata madagascariensis]|uniref:Protein MCM10 homolog n=1 Tax=Trichonephila inaurata madagascariensis TaxID=2747483 RepID=A0A8X6WLB0_9ARAC|nr:protein MCM10 homolog [Trichonephila inaurata madagascariensis]